MSDPIVTFQSVFDSIRSRCEAFPAQKLENRLVNLGIKELIDDNKCDSFGIPFKYVDHLDESTLALAYFVNRFRKERGKIKVHGSHRLQKGEDKTLSPWVNERSRLFLELQNILMLLNGIDGREVEIKRVFILRDISDIAFFSQSAISVLSEQVALGIKIGFLFMNDFGETRRESAELRHILSSSLTVEYSPEGETQPEQKNFFLQCDTIRQKSLRNNIPYLRGCVIRWADDVDQALTLKNNQDFSSDDLERHRQLFSGWKPFNQENLRSGHVISILNNNEKKFANDALVMVLTALENSNGNSAYNSTAFINRVFDNVITADLVRLEKAMNAFDTAGVNAIRAVDSTSVKNTLNVHESDPTYRQWIRRSINRVISDETGEATIERIYIIDDSHDKKNEDATLIRNLQYYIDFLAYEVEEIASVASKDGATDFRISNEPVAWIERNRMTLKERIKVYVTTTRNLEDFVGKIRNVATKEALSIFTGKTVGDASFSTHFSKLDYLFTDEMLYDFNNERGDPSELKFSAFLLRKSFDPSAEQKDLFRFPGLEELKLDSKKHVRKRRIQGFANAIVDYWENYENLPDDVISQEEIKDLVERSGKDENVATRHEEEILTRYRANLEERLYDHLIPHASLLFETLKEFSLEIRLFENPQASLVTDIPPFNARGFDIHSLTSDVKKAIESNLERRDSTPPTKPKKNASGSSDPSAKSTRATDSRKPRGPWIGKS